MIKNEIVNLDNTAAELFELEESADKTVKALSYIPSFFTTASLPFRNIHKTVFKRKGSNGVSLTLTSPFNVPFGKYGRLLLSVLTTHAVLCKEQNAPVTIDFSSMAELLREMMLTKQRGKDIKEQLECFSNATFAFNMVTEKMKAGYLFKDLYEGEETPKDKVIEKQHTTGNIRFTSGVQFSEITDEKLGSKIGSIKIILSAEFAGFCQRHAVPIDYSVYKDIMSPVGKDIYAWLVYRNNGIKENEAVFIPRDKLVEQFMPVNEDVTDFKKMESNNYNEILGIIENIKTKYYPDLKIDLREQSNGITLHKSKAHITPNDKRFALITSMI